MKIIKNNIIPFKGFVAITLWPFIFIRKDKYKQYNYIIKCHEKIHGKQQKELLIIFFLLWYGIEWFIKWIYYNNCLRAYKNISFEREAYSNQNNTEYLGKRKPFSFIHYIRK